MFLQWSKCSYTTMISPKTAIFVLQVVLCLTQAQSKTLNALFLGNSYTYYNDLPAIVRELATADGQTLTTDEHLGLNYTFVSVKVNWKSFILQLQLIINALEKCKNFIIWALEGGWSLEDHWNSDETLEKIREGAWDIVVLQGQSQETSNQQDVICTDRDFFTSSWNQLEGY